jgi:hypothetical protein
VTATRQFIDIAPGDALALSGPADVALIGTKGRRVRLCVSAERETVVRRVPAGDKGRRDCTAPSVAGSLP